MTKAKFRESILEAIKQAESKPELVTTSDRALFVLGFLEGVFCTEEPDQAESANVTGPN